MASVSSDRALFCLFHNDHMYLRPGNSPCSHIFSGVVRKSRKGISIFGVDYDGQRMGINTDIVKKEFNLAAMAPIPIECGDQLEAIVEHLNMLGRKELWPFYFSRDMDIRPEREKRGVPAITPEGEIIPKACQQNIFQYGSGVSELTLARINCVRMSLLTACFAGLDLSFCAGADTRCQTGEDVRDLIWQKMSRVQPASGYTVSLPGGSGKGDARLTLDGEGNSYFDHGVPIKVRDFLGGLQERIRGRALFDQMVDIIPDGILSNRSMGIPSYLKEAFDELDKKAAGKAKKRSGGPSLDFLSGFLAPRPAKT
jgi:hypothetical protein